jgi:hypothetical protein
MKMHAIVTPTAMRADTQADLASVQLDEEERVFLAPLVKTKYMLIHVVMRTKGGRVQNDRA